MEVMEPIGVRLGDFIQHARTAVLREISIANSQCDFSHNIICDFVNSPSCAGHLAHCLVRDTQLPKLSARVS